jgi:hypothetical protein
VPAAFAAAAVFHAISILKTAGAFDLFRLKQKLRAGARQKSQGDACKPRRRLGFSLFRGCSRIRIASRNNCAEPAPAFSEEYKP